MNKKETLLNINDNKNNNNVLCLTSAIFIALMLVWPSKCLKQIIQIKLNRAKNSSWPGANQLAMTVYKGHRGFELGTTEKKSS